MSERIVCPYCNASFRSPATAAAHLKEHEKEPAETMQTLSRNFETIRKS
jgi:hypothetical protein